MLSVEIDHESGFCFGVTTAIQKAEEELRNGRPLYCLGDIVHNGIERDRVKAMGLITINHEEFAALRNVKVLLRAHGEPPETYATALRNQIEIIDATCPVVLQLQRRIKREYDAPTSTFAAKQIVIYGKRGHAEGLGLVGQTGGTARVVESMEEVEQLDFTHDIRLYSQTTKSLEGFRAINQYIQSHIAPPATFRGYDTICRQVANRISNIQQFAVAHDLVFFVSGRKSSNGRILFDQCRQVNPHVHLIEGAAEIDLSMLDGVERVGICGATSTPKWLMEECRDYILRHCPPTDALSKK